MEDKLSILYPSLDEEVIQLVIEQAEYFILDYCNVAEIPAELEPVILEMCKEDINKIGAEGLSSETAGGAALSYIPDYSDKVYKRLKKHKRIKCV